jgi:hypothetical protein
MASREKIEPPTKRLKVKMHPIEPIKIARPLKIAPPETSGDQRPSGGGNERQGGFYTADYYFERHGPGPRETPVAFMSEIGSGTLAPHPVSPDSPPIYPPIDSGKMVEDDRIITKPEGRYFPISLAADVAHVPRTTLVDWIKAKSKFEGRPLKTYNSPTAKKLYLAEESIQRVANRFIRWPSKEPAGPVTVGETKDKSGYIGISKAAQMIGVDHHTMWLWTTQGKAPVDRPPDVVKCSASDQFYIREKDLSELKKLIPRSGLRRGRRPKATPNP